MIITGGRYGAFTIGHVSVGDIETLNDSLAFAHEYGHYIFSLLSGPLYLVHGIASLIHANKYGESDDGYYEYQTEIEADKLGGVQVEWKDGKIIKRRYP